MFSLQFRRTHSRIPSCVLLYIVYFVCSAWNALLSAVFVCVCACVSAPCVVYALCASHVWMACCPMPIQIQSFCSIIIIIYQFGDFILMLNKCIENRRDLHFSADSHSYKCDERNRISVTSTWLCVVHVLYSTYENASQLLNGISKFPIVNELNIIRSKLHATIAHFVLDWHLRVKALENI